MYNRARYNLQRYNLPSDTETDIEFKAEMMEVLGSAVGQYTYGGSAYSWRYHISVRNAYTSEMIAEDTLYGGSPPASFTGSPGESMTGAPPSDEDVAACIEALYAQALAVGTAE